MEIAEIPVTNLEKDLKFPPLRLTFSDPAANLSDLHKPLTGGAVRLDPSIPGAWRWDDDRHLTFQPSQDWPAHQKFRVIFQRSLFPRQVIMERLAYEVQDAALHHRDQRAEVAYQDPNNPGQRQITVTLEASHPIEHGELERHLNLDVLGGSLIFPTNEPGSHFLQSPTACMIGWLIFRTSNITLPEK